VAVDADGTLSLVHNTEGMYRGSVTASGVFSAGIYGDDFGPV
jgi:beta-aspartyl-peptidase (threonine type)